MFVVQLSFMVFQFIKHMGNEPLITVFFLNTESHGRNAKLYPDSKLKVNVNPLYYWGVNSKYRVYGGRYWEKQSKKKMM